MSWNDSNNDRHVIAERLINKLSSLYPSVCKFRVVTFGGKTARCFFSAFKFTENPFNERDNANLLYPKREFADTINHFSGIAVVRNENSFPVNLMDGVLVFERIGL
jgi:hypothetical protein